jgi:hypothetical protein
MEYFQLDDADFTGFSPESYTVPLDTRGYIYMVHDYTDPDFIKIGRTTNLHKRVTSYNTDRPRNSVQIVAVTGLFSDAVEVEKRIFSSINTYHEAVPSKGTKEWYEIALKERFLTLMAQAESYFEMEKVT